MNWIWKWLMAPAFSFQETGWPERTGTTKIMRIEVIGVAVFFLILAIAVVWPMVSNPCTFHAGARAVGAC